jgi:ATP-dependent exoDNAse (exonuclease V) alpha subunit
MRYCKDVAAGQVLWVDEAGFLSSKQMHWLVDFAARKRCRLILSGDTRQHHAVERGDALRVLEASGAVTMASLTKIIRQRIEPLREAVQDLSQGRTGEGFENATHGANHCRTLVRTSDGTMTLPLKVSRFLVLF